MSIDGPSLSIKVGEKEIISSDVITPLQLSNGTEMHVTVGGKIASYLTIFATRFFCLCMLENKKISNDQELIQSDPTSCPQNQKGNN